MSLRIGLMLFKEVLNRQQEARAKNMLLGNTIINLSEIGKY
jgi:hypothetical protein